VCWRIFKRGEILEERGNIEGAKAEFTKATERYYQLAKKDEKKYESSSGHLRKAKACSA
jgi:hypothetical protein